MKFSLLATSAIYLSVVRGAPQADNPSSTLSSSSRTSTSTLSTTLQAPASTATAACNNSPLLCNRLYSNITHMGAHEAPFSRADTTANSQDANQSFNVTDALSAGIRLLHARVSNNDGALQFCQGGCSYFNEGLLATWLTAIANWLLENPNEVITIMLGNPDAQSVATFGRVFNNTVIEARAYIPANITQSVPTWPTLQTMIDDGANVVVFVEDVQYDTTYPYLLPRDSYVFTTIEEQTSVSDFTCQLGDFTNAPSASQAISRGYLGLVNHYLQKNQTQGRLVPDVSQINITNSPDINDPSSLGAHAARCANEWGTKPAFMLVDFWNVGPSIQTADDLNGIVATERGSVNQSVVTAHESSGSRRESWSLLGATSLAVGVVAVGNFAWL